MPCAHPIGTLRRRPTPANSHSTVLWPDPGARHNARHYAVGLAAGLLVRLSLGRVEWRSSRDTLLGAGHTGPDCSTDRRFAVCHRAAVPH